MAISSSTVLNVAPELSSVSSERMSYFITEASRYINSTKWGAKSDFAHALLTAHLLTISNKNGISGEVIEEKVGDLSRKFSSSGSDVSSLASTSYGKQFLQLRKSLIISPMVIS